MAKHKRIPKDFPVKPLRLGTKRFEKAKTPTQCLSCNLYWDDAVITGLTPVPSGRCPFEYFHKEGE